MGKKIEINIAVKVLKQMLDENFDNEYYWGIFGEYRLNEFLENFKNNLERKDKNIRC